MKIFLNILLLIIILSYQFKDVVVYINFKINESYIARNMCENVDKPYLSCHGKCVLRKQIQSTQQQESKNLPLKVKAPTHLQYCIPILKNLFLQAIDLKNNCLEHFYSSPFNSFKLIKKMLKPPQFLLSH